MGCRVCEVELTENDLFYCNSCEDVRRRWEEYCVDNNIYKKRREYKFPGRKNRNLMISSPPIKIRRKKNEI